MNTKKWYESTTIWINLAGVLVVAIGYVLDFKLVKDTDVVALLMAVANILNRFRAPKKVESIEKSII